MGQLRQADDHPTNQKKDTKVNKKVTLPIITFLMTLLKYRPEETNNAAGVTDLSNVIQTEQKSDGRGRF